MKLIVAVSCNWGIGKNGGLLFSIPTDMKFFRETTKGSTVIMGRKTLDSFPCGKPLKNRRNIVLTNDKNFTREDTIVCHSKDEVLSAVKNDENIFVIGGEAIYSLFLDECDTAYITKVEKEVEADKFLANFDNLPDWELESQSEKITENDCTFTFCTYKRENRPQN